MTEQEIICAERERILDMLEKFTPRYEDRAGIETAILLINAEQPLNLRGVRWDRLVKGWIEKRRASPDYLGETRQQ